MSTAKSHVPVIEYLDTKVGPNSPVKVRIKAANGEVIHFTNQKYRDPTDGRRSVQDLQNALCAGLASLTIADMIADRQIKEKRIKKEPKKLVVTPRGGM
jgi:hypothetical protein